jgi:glycerol uptake facilitator-like aquaporin
MAKTGKSSWKPPIQLLFLDLFGIALLVLGLMMHYAPDSALSQALPASLRLPLLVVGGGMFAAGWAGMLLSLLEHRRA